MDNNPIFPYAVIVQKRKTTIVPRFDVIFFIVPLLGSHKCVTH